MSPLRVFLATLVVGLLMAPTASADLLATTTSTVTSTTTSITSTATAVAGELLVGFHGQPDLAVLENVTVERTLGTLRVVQIKTNDVAAATDRFQKNPAVAFVEANDDIQLAASSWDASSWDASSWDASSWDASSWDASSWDASSWDASSWDASSWDASSWDASSWDTTTMDPGYPHQWGLGAANFPDAWRIERGSGRVGVCVLDTGIDATHPDLRPHILTYNGQYGRSAMLNGAGGSAFDDVGHGTHVAGIIAAVAGNATGIVGAAKEPILAIKVMDASGGKEADLARGLAMCVHGGARIATMSLHLTQHSPTVQRAIESAQAAGILVIASAGNDGLASVRYPAAYPGVIAVGAVTSAGERAGFSNYGPRLDILAPGHKIVSTFPGNQYRSGSGTSQAAPFVAAAAALAWEIQPSANATAIRDALLATARTLPDGKALDAGAALASLRPT